MPEDENPIEILTKLKIAVAILAAMVVAVAYLGYYNIKTSYDHIESLKTNIQSQSSKLTDNKANLDKLKASKKKRVEEEPPEKDVYVPAERGLPPEDVLAGEFAEILEIARANTIKMRSIDFEYNPSSDKFVDKARDKFNVALLKMSMIGTYKNFENFLRDLYKHEHFLDISTVKLEPYVKDKSILLIDFNMKMYAQR